MTRRRIDRPAARLDFSRRTPGDVVEFYPTRDRWGNRKPRAVVAICPVCQRPGATAKTQDGSVGYNVIHAEGGAEPDDVCFVPPHLRAPR